MLKIIFDIETDGLHDTTKIHVMSWRAVGDKEVKSTNDYNKMREVLSGADVLIGHNIISFDLPQIKKLLGLEVKAKIYDTLGISWYLYPKSKRHGLAAWGERLGVIKPTIDNWEDLTYEEYAHRCEEDVEINTRLWSTFEKTLNSLYDGNYERFLGYISFKLNCIRLQEESKWKLDVEKAKENLEKLSIPYQEKYEELKKIMPKVPKYRVKSRPKKMYKMDGSLSSLGEKWFEFLEEQGLPKDHTDDVSYIYKYEDPKPTSPKQIKDMLFDLGWEPMHFKYERKDDGTVKKIPQITSEFVPGEVCQSVLDASPDMEVLNGFSIIKHRISVIEGFLESQVDGYLRARVSGLTNTLRFKHSEIVNLPGVSKLYGEYIRCLLVAPEGYELCGSDKSSLEEKTKQHYLYPYDPDYVKEMQVEGYDAHLMLAEFSKAITKEDIKRYQETGDKDIKKIRSEFKGVNYGATYGIKALSLSRLIKCSEAKAERLLEEYWKKNWSIKAVASNAKVKKVSGQMWLLNPVSGFWYQLRYKKDIFSTLNQGTGVYCFDVWISNILSKRKQLTAQFHDEIVLTIKKGQRDKCEALLKWALDKTNEQLKLNVKLGIDIQFGMNYGEIH